MGVFVVLVAACLTAEFFWWVVGAVVVGVLVWLNVKAYKQAVADEAEDRQRVRELVKRADEQHSQVLADDVHGVFGEYPPASVA